MTTCVPAGTSAMIGLPTSTGPPTLVLPSSLHDEPQDHSFHGWEQRFHFEQSTKSPGQEMTLFVTVNCSILCPKQNISKEKKKN